MPSRMAALLAAALLGLPLLAGAPAQAYTIRSADIIGSYDPTEVGHGARRGRDLPALVVGNPFPVAPEITAQAVSQGMRDGRGGPAMSLAEIAVAPMRVIWQLAGGTRTGSTICDRRGPLPAAGPHAGNVNVVATYCRGDSAMTQVIASIDKISDPRDPEFINFINQITTNLFPPRNPEQNGDHNWRR